MAYPQPVVADFKVRFDRDFQFAIDQTDVTKVRNTDINRAITQAAVNFNIGLWANLESYVEAFLLLAAHYLCRNILASTQGLGGSAEWLTNSKAVGNVSESFAIPERIAKSPYLAGLSRTLYGITYLELVLPMLTGNVASVFGDTTP